MSEEFETRRERLKSALYLGLQENGSGDPLETKNQEKTRTVPRNIERWDTLVPSGSVGYV